MSQPYFRLHSKTASGMMSCGNAPRVNRTEYIEIGSSQKTSQVRAEYDDAEKLIAIVVDGGHYVPPTLIANAEISFAAPDGRVLAEVQLDELGEVQVTRVLSGHPGIAHRDVSAIVADLKFAPGTIDARPVAAITSVTIRVQKGIATIAQSRRT